MEKTETNQNTFSNEESEEFLTKLTKYSQPDKLGEKQLDFYKKAQEDLKPYLQKLDVVKESFPFPDDMWFSFNYYLKKPIKTGDHYQIYKNIKDSKVSLEYLREYKIKSYNFWDENDEVTREEIEEFVSLDDIDYGASVLQALYVNRERANELFNKHPEKNEVYMKVDRKDHHLITLCFRDIEKGFKTLIKALEKKMWEKWCDSREFNIETSK